MAGSKTILCIEDDHFISEMYEHALKNAGYIVTIIDSGKDAVKTAQKGGFDLILLDIWIPVKNGIQVLKELRGENGKGLPETKIIITTNYAQDDHSRAASAAQADGYFIKAEITPKQLVQTVQRIIGSAKSQ
ncbi:response regulator [Candidatus Saccharibacteria bacterium]|nr:response regulator [Candidatus Saccharibacteria bacterium]